MPARIKRPASVTPPAQRTTSPEPAAVAAISGPCARGAHGRCTGRVYNTSRASHDDPRFIACDCTKRACPHGADSRARHRAAASA